MGSSPLGEIVTDASGVHAFFGFALHGIAPGAASDRLARQAQLLSRVCMVTANPLTEERAFELRYVVTPRTKENGWRGAVRCVVLARLSLALDDHPSAHARLDAFHADLVMALATTLPAYVFAPLAEVEAVNAALRPFAIADVVEFQHPVRPAPGLGLGDAPARLALPLPLMGLPDADTVIELLLRQPHPTLWSLCFGPAGAENVRAALETHVLALPHLRDPLAAGVAHSSEPLFRSHEEQRPAITSSTIAQWQQHHLAALLQRAFRMRLHLVSSGPLSADLIAAVAAELGGPGTFTADNAWRDAALPIAASAAWHRPRTSRHPGATITEFASSVQRLETLGFAAHADAYPSDRHTDDGLAALAGLADLGEATRLFALPVMAPWLPQRQTALTLPYESAATRGLFLGVNEVNGSARSVLLPEESRFHHLWAVGQTGTGKSTFLEAQILQDVGARRGVIVMDPHGDLIRNLCGKIPRRRLADVILFDPADTEYPLGINPLDAEGEDARTLVVSSFIGLLRKLYDPHQQGIVGPRFEHAARNGLLSVMSLPERGTLIEVVRLFQDASFMREVIPHITDPLVRRYWTDQIARTNDFHLSEVLDWIVSKFGHFVTDPLLRRIIGQSHSGFSFRQAMDEGKIVLLSLAKGRLGSENANFLGLILLPMILHAALSRADLPERKRRPVALYVDEFQNYATDSLAQMLAEARKYRMALTLANQHVGQLTPEIRDAVVGNVGSVLAFRLGLSDAVALAQLLEPSPLAAEHLVGLPNFTAYGRALIAGQHTPVFTLRTQPARERFAEARLRAVREHTRATYARPRAVVDAEIEARAHLQITATPPRRGAMLLTSD